MGIEVAVNGAVAIYVVRGPWGNVVAISNGRSKFYEATVYFSE